MTDFLETSIPRESFWPIQVTAKPLSAILEEIRVRDIDFLKIDVEGAEQDVLAGLDLRRWRSIVSMIEAVTPTKPPRSNHEAWEPSLIVAGYRFVYFDGLNRFYLREESAELARHFLTPVNAFDECKRFGDVCDPFLNRQHPLHAFATVLARKLVRNFALGGSGDAGALYKLGLSPKFLAEAATVPRVKWAFRAILVRETRPGEAESYLSGRGLSTERLIDELLACDEVVDFRIASASVAA